MTELVVEDALDGMDVVGLAEVAGGQGAHEGLEDIGPEAWGSMGEEGEGEQEVV